MKKLLLRNGALIGLDPLRIEKRDLLVVDGVIADRDHRISPDRETEVIDCRGRVVMPGFVDAHARLQHSQVLGVQGGLAPGDRSRAEYVESALAPESVVTAAFAGALAAIRSGTTTVFDLHASPGCAAESLQLVRDVLLTVGLRAGVSYANRPGETEYEGSSAANAAFCRQNRGEKLRGLIGGRSANGELGPLAADAESWLHLELDGGEAPAGRTTIVAGASAPSANENEPWYAYCPGDDAPRGVDFTALGGRGALGTAGRPTNMFQELRTAYYQAVGAGRNVDARRVIDLAVGSHALASEVFGAEFGSFRRGAVADLIILDYHARTPMTSENVADHILFAMGPEHVDTVIIEGSVVYRGGRFSEVDVRKLAPLMRRGAEELWKALESADAEEAVTAAGDEG